MKYLSIPSAIALMTLAQGVMAQTKPPVALPEPNVLTLVALAVGAVVVVRKLKK